MDEQVMPMLTLPFPMLVANHGSEAETGTSTKIMTIADNLPSSGGPPVGTGDVFQVNSGEPTAGKGENGFKASNLSEKHEYMPAFMQLASSQSERPGNPVASAQNDGSNAQSLAGEEPPQAINPLLAVTKSERASEKPGDAVSGLSPVLPGGDVINLPAVGGKTPAVSHDDFSRRGIATIASSSAIAPENAGQFAEKLSRDRSPSKVQPSSEEIPASVIATATEAKSSPVTIPGLVVSTTQPAAERKDPIAVAPSPTARVPSSQELPNPQTPHTSPAVGMPLLDLHLRDDLIPSSRAASKEDGVSSSLSVSNRNRREDVRANQSAEHGTQSNSELVVRMVDRSGKGGLSTEVPVALVPPDVLGHSVLSEAVNLATQGTQFSSAALTTTTDPLSPELKSGSPPALPPPSDGVAPPTINTTPAAIQTARMMEHIGQVEMRVGLRTEVFGSVQLHTIIHDNQVGLTVGSERGNLRTFLAAEVPDLTTSLRQHDLRFEGIRFLESSLSAGGGYSGGADAHAQSFRQPQAPRFSLLKSETLNPEELTAHLEVAKRTGLSVHA